MEIFWERKYKKVTPEIKAEMFRLRDEGFKNCEIAKKFGFTRSTVTYHLNKDSQQNSKDISKKRWASLSKEQRRAYYDKHKYYQMSYQRQRYRQDPQFREIHKNRVKEIMARKKEAVK